MTPSPTDPLLASLLAAVEASPTDVPLRLHTASLLIDAGREQEAVSHCAVALQHEPGSTQARALMARALGTVGAAAPAAPASQPAAPAAGPGGGYGVMPPAPAPAGGFDWEAAERQLGDGAPPQGAPGQQQPLPTASRPLDAVHAGGASPDLADAWEVERAGVMLDDVAGMEEVKQRLTLSFLAPMANPGLRRMYGASLRGGLLLYGPPGCGKTYIARAVAGQMGASFINVTLASVLDKYVGESEKAVHALFETARAHAPAVVFIDEVDALGHRRTGSSDFSTLRNVVNQLLTEMDGVTTDNDGVYVLAATNTPWDVDPALRRPGRLDRAVAVLPPDEPARAAVLAHHLTSRPCGPLDLRALARATPEFSGADLAHLVASATELAMMSSLRSGRPRPLLQEDLTTALASLRPSTLPWFEVARNVVTYADTTGEYAELAAYMSARGML